MFKKICLLAIPVLLFVSQPAFSQSVEQRQSKAEKDLLELEGQRQQLAQILLDYQTEVNKAEKKYTDALSAKSVELLGTSKTLDQNRYNQLEYDINKLKESHKTAKFEFDKKHQEAKTKLAKIESDIETTKKIVLSEMNQGTTAVSTSTVVQLTKSHEQEIAALGAKIDLQTLATNFEGTDDKIDELERIYDRSEVGAYVQEKVSQLMNSMTICRAMRRCEVKEEAPLDPKLIQEELFPESKATRSEHYQKVKTRRSGSSQ